MGRKELQKRFSLKIILKQKESLLEEAKNKQLMEEEINEILTKFIKKTGRKVKPLIIQEKDQYKLLLEIE